MSHDMQCLRVVLDTSVIVAGLRSQLGASYQLLLLVSEQKLVPRLTTTVFLEYEDVLLRAEQRLATGMSDKDVAGFLAAFASAAAPVEVHFRWRPQLRDADDEMVLEAAVNGNADALITHNVADFRSVARDFALRVMTPAELLKELDQ